MSRPRPEPTAHLLVDGYNLIKTLPRFQEQERVSLASARASLEDALRTYADRAACRVTLVYDGGPQAAARTGGRGGRRLEVVFSEPPEKADDVIRRLVEQRHGARYLRVVTSDRQIRRFAGRHKVRSTPAAEFALELEAPPRPDVHQHEGPPPLEFDPDPRVDPQEVEAWERLFRQRQE
ncbi:MAG: NYN domain-containing protein [Candidatus Latescibacterota bacterium]